MISIMFVLVCLLLVVKWMMLTLKLKLPILIMAVEVADTVPQSLLYPTQIVNIVITFFSRIMLWML